LPVGKGFFIPPAVSKTFTIKPVDSILDIDAEGFRYVTPEGDPFLSQGFLGALERHGAAAPHLGWTPQHLVAHDSQGQLAGLLPLYVKTNSFGEFIYDWSWASAFEQSGLAYYPKLFSGIPYTPATGARLWVRSDEDAGNVRNALIDTAIELAQENRMSSWHVAFPDADDCAALTSAGLLVRHDVQYHWQHHAEDHYRDFDDYLASFSADKRRKVRAERRKVIEAGVEIEVLIGNAISPALWIQIHALYVSTFDKYGNYPALSAQCLAEIGQALGDRMVVFVARRNGDPVATSICFRNNDTLYGRYWGAAERIDGLHFDLCYYQGIEYCLRHGLQRFEPGAGGEHKIARGFEPVSVTTLHWIADERMREILRKHLQRNSDAVEQYAEEVREHLPFKNTL
jgi:predicted N-acyltransferase